MNSKLRRKLLENWFALDYILFGDKAPNALSEHRLREYYITKNALVENTKEIYKATKSLAYPDANNLKELYLEGVAVAKECSDEAVKIMNLYENEIASDMSINLTESESWDRPEKVAISRKLLEFAIDYLVYAGTEFETLNESWDGKILVESHKQLRDTLIKYVSFQK